MPKTPGLPQIAMVEMIFSYSPTLASEGFASFGTKNTDSRMTLLVLLDDETGPPATVVPDDLGCQFTEMFIKSPENMVLLLDLLGVSNTPCQVGKVCLENICQKINF